MLELPLVVAAFVAGVLMFLAPCTLPIVPGYLAFIAGGSGKIMRNAVAFVLGFSLIFMLLGASFGYLGALVAPWRELFAQAAGLVFILFGLAMLGVRIPLLSGERRIGAPRFLTLGRSESSFFIGALFALGWSPCIGPILGSALYLASNSATVLQGTLLLAVFSAGLGVPFLLTAWFIDSAGHALARFGAAAVFLTRIAALLLIAVGTLMLTGTMGSFVARGLSYFSGFYDALLPYM